MLSFSIFMKEYTSVHRAQPCHYQQKVVLVACKEEYCRKDIMLDIGAETIKGQMND